MYLLNDVQLTGILEFASPEFNFQSHAEYCPWGNFLFHLEFEC